MGMIILVQVMVVPIILVLVMIVWDRPKKVLFSIDYEPKNTGLGACEP